MQIEPMQDWQDHILAGRQYLKTAGKGLSRRAVFNNELIFQLAAMAIEKIMVGVCQYHRHMPTDHTLSGLVEALASICPVDAELADSIRGLELIDNMCALTPIQRKPPGDLEIQGILTVGRAVAGFARQHAPMDEGESKA